MKYKFSTKETKMEEVKPTSKNMMDIIKSKLTPIEYLIFTHNITELVKKELKKSNK
jgi:hypothetical protein